MDKEWVISREELSSYVNEKKEAYLAIQKMDEEINLDSFIVKNGNHYVSRVIAIKHSDGSYLEFHSACFRKYSKNFFFVFTEHHGNHIYHNEDVECIMSWEDLGEKKSTSKILYKRRINV